MLLDPAAKQRSVDGSVNGKPCDESFLLQRVEKGGGLPTTTRSLFHQLRADRRAAVAACHVGFGPRFIDEYDFVGIDLLLRSAPLSTLRGHIGAILHAGNQRFFFATALDQPWNCSINWSFDSLCTRDSKAG